MRYSTRNVPADRYRGLMRQSRTHTLDTEMGESLCRRFSELALGPPEATDEHAPPTCPKCLRQDPRFDRQDVPVDPREDADDDYYR